MALSGTDLLELLCWPLFTAGVLIIYWASRIKDEIAAGKRAALGVVAVAMLLGPLLYITWKSNQSAAAAFNTDVLILVMGASALVAAYLHRNSPRSGSRRRCSACGRSASAAGT
jgi:peptidoglycan/LPS O-acetylase OafA/YrhL